MWEKYNINVKMISINEGKEKIMRKEAVKAAAWLMSACLLMGSLPASPGRTRKVSAAEPEIEGFATKGRAADRL